MKRIHLSTVTWSLYLIRRRSLQVTMDHNTTTTSQYFHACVTIIYVKKSILCNLHTVFLSLYRYSTYPSIHCLKRWVFLPYLFLFSALIFWTVHLLLFLPHRPVSVTCCSFCAPHLKFVYSFVLNQGWLATQSFFLQFCLWWVVQPWL